MLAGISSKAYFLFTQASLEMGLLWEQRKTFRSKGFLFL